MQPLELEAQVLISASTWRRLCLQALGKLRHEREAAEEGEREPKERWMKLCSIALVTGGAAFDFRGVKREAGYHNEGGGALALRSSSH